MKSIFLFILCCGNLFFPIEKSELKHLALLSWDEYYEKTFQYKNPRETLKKAVSYFEGPGFAIDLGCGVGRDTRYLAEKGWQVLAVDAESEAETYLWKMVGEYAAHVQFIHSDFESFSFPEGTSLINASYALPFCSPEAFGKVMNRLKNSLAAGGRFAGQFFGTNDTWNGNPHMVFLARDEVEKLLEGFELEYYLEEEFDGESADGVPKHWHVHHLVARKL